MNNNRLRKLSGQVLNEAQFLADSPFTKIAKDIGKLLGAEPKSFDSQSSVIVFNAPKNGGRLMIKDMQMLSRLDIISIDFKKDGTVKIQLKS